MKLAIPLTVFVLTLTGHFTYFAHTQSLDRNPAICPETSCPETALRADCNTEEAALLKKKGLLASYISTQDYFLGISYGLALGFTAFSLIIFRENRKRGAAGALGGLGLSGVLAVTGCFLIGCCGSPMLAVYLGLLGSKFLGFAKPLIAVVTALSVTGGYIWLTVRSRSCCKGGVCEIPPDKTA